MLSVQPAIYPFRNATVGLSVGLVMLLFWQGLLQSDCNRYLSCSLESGIARIDYITESG